MQVRFRAALVEWRGPAPFVWCRLPEDACQVIRDDAAATTYGWGAIPVRVRIGATEWETSLMPRDGGYLLPVRSAVQRAEGLALGDDVEVALQAEPRGGRAANGTGPTT